MRLELDAIFSRRDRSGKALVLRRPVGALWTEEGVEEKVSIQIDASYPAVTSLVLFDRHVFDFR